MSYGISGQIYELVSSFHSDRRLCVVLDGKFSEENPVNAKVPQGSIFGPSLFVLCIMTFLMMLSVILLSMVMILFSTLSVTWHLTCGNSWKWLLNLNVICETLLTEAGSGVLISVLEKLN